MDITQLPFNRLIGIQRTNMTDAWLMLPADERYTNHLGTVHASALLALAEATSGEFLRREIGSIGFDVLPVVRKLESKFRKPAHGAIYSKVRSGAENVPLFVRSLEEKGRATISVGVDVFDEASSHALASTVEWFVIRKE